jgi:hypothetical protein
LIGKTTKTPRAEQRARGALNAYFDECSFLTDKRYEKNGWIPKAKDYKNSLIYSR